MQKCPENHIVKGNQCSIIEESLNHERRGGSRPSNQSGIIGYNSQNISSIFSPSFLYFCCWRIEDSLNSICTLVVGEKTWRKREVGEKVRKCFSVFNDSLSGLNHHGNRVAATNLSLLTKRSTGNLALSGSNVIPSFPASGGLENHALLQLWLHSISSCFSIVKYSRENLKKQMHLERTVCESLRKLSHLSQT